MSLFLLKHWIHYTFVEDLKWNLHGIKLLLFSLLNHKHHIMKKLNLTLLLALSISIMSCSSSEVSNEDPVVIDPTTKVTYEKDVKNIINNSCAVSGCHTGSSPAAGIAFNTYNQVRSQAENGNLIGRINSGSNPMPPTGLLPTSTRSIIDQWKADGFLEN